jgi:hypothetical protein
LGKIDKSLTRENYTKLLRIIGLSKRPLSSYEIKKELEKYGWKETEAPYVYEMIKQLVSFRKESNTLLYKSDKIWENKHEIKRLIKTLNNHFNLGWKEHDIDDNKIEVENYNHIIKIEDSVGDTSIEIEKDPKLPRGVLKIVHGSKSYNSLPLLYYDDSVYLDNNLVDRDDKPRLKYFNRLYGLNVNYLDIQLDGKSNKAIADKMQRIREMELVKENKIKEIREKDEYAIISVMDFVTAEETQIHSEIFGIENNKRKWRYDLNVRGLILYILGEIRLEETDYKKIHNNRISKVLENLSSRKADEFVFLWCYRNFREQYKVLKDIENLPNYYEVELLKKIARELQYLVYNADIKLLEYWVIRRYSGEITYYLIAAAREGLLHLSGDTVSLIREYQLKNLYAMNRYLAEEHQELGNAYDSLSHSSFGEDLQIYF